jgi:monoamine oxidase
MSTSSIVDKDDGDDIVDVCIVGAGLSGAYAAYLLRDYSVAVVDARCRVGGRLLTVDGGVDLGGSWIWPRSEYVMKRFIDQLGINTVDQYVDGESFARAPDGRIHSIPPGGAGRYVACGGGAVRVSGGAATMVHTLLQNDDHDIYCNLSIHLGMRVVRIEHSGDVMRVVYVEAEEINNEITKTIRCRTVILAAPPKVLANSICFHPPLAKVKIDSMLATPTWMEDYGKVAVSFPLNWWRRLNMSAVSIDQKGPVSTWWEACSGNDGDGLYPTLAGFVTATGANKLQKLDSTEALHDHVIDSLTAIYCINASDMGMQVHEVGVKINETADKDGISVVKGGITVTYKSWLKDGHTNVSSSYDVDFACDYGDVNLRESVRSIFFAGTETSHGSGHMEGAIISAQRVADEAIQYLRLMGTTTR